MVAFEVNDMSCGGCAASITRPVQARDRAASVSVDVPGRRVEISGTVLDSTAFGAAIAAAGHTPVLAEAPATGAAAAKPTVGSGCCCS